MFAGAAVVVAMFSTGLGRPLDLNYPPLPVTHRPPVPIIVEHVGLRAGVSPTAIIADGRFGGVEAGIASGSQWTIRGVLASGDDRSAQLIVRSDQPLFLVSSARRVPSPAAPDVDNGFTIVVANRTLGSVQRPCVLVRFAGGTPVPLAGSAAVRCGSA
jgi:hypothetical protein